MTHWGTHHLSPDLWPPESWGLNISVHLGSIHGTSAWEGISSLLWTWDLLLLSPLFCIFVAGKEMNRFAVCQQLIGESLGPSFLGRMLRVLGLGTLSGLKTSIKRDLLCLREGMSGLGVSNQEGWHSVCDGGKKTFWRNISTRGFSTVNLGCAIQNPHSVHQWASALRSWIRCPSRWL